jgi:hypothetical protein
MATAWVWVRKGMGGFKVGASRVWTMGGALRDGRIQAVDDGSKVACLDGDCGNLDGAVVDVVDPADSTVTHVGEAARERSLGADPVGRFDLRRRSSRVHDV